MKIYYSIEDFNPLPYGVVTSGTFDGVHVGHQTILNRLKEVAAAHGGETVLITYWPHPRTILKPEEPPVKLLTTFEEKAQLLKAQGIHHLLRIPFTQEFSKLSSSAFIQEILVKRLGTRKLVIGYDHRFGKNREGSFEQLKQNAPSYGFDVEEIPRQEIDHVTVSSSKIRKALSEGDLPTATHLLARPYGLTGRVVPGDKLGRMLGFPTANLDPESALKLVPREGIYAVRVRFHDQTFGGMLYIGTRPTVDGKRVVIEVNIFDFDQEIYGELLTVEFLELIRFDARFRDLEELKAQLFQDREAALKILNP
jgi:riboflavin kinase/FMN adenylyltransferase